MISLLKNIESPITINGVLYENGKQAAKQCKIDGDKIEILISKQSKKSFREQAGLPRSEVEKRITVKQYMTRPATDDFKFMQEWNNNVPMPLRTMIGTVVKETRGMVYMKLHGDIVTEKTQRCLKCGRPITNPVSQYFGVGPECGGHNYVNPFYSKEELEAAVKDYRENVLQKMTWEGWIIKSAILEEETIQ